MIIFQKYHQEKFSDKDCDAVYMQVYSKHRALAKVAAEFVNQRVFLTIAASHAALRTHSGKTRHLSFVFRDLVKFFTST